MGWSEGGLGAAEASCWVLVHSSSIPASQPRCSGLSAKASTMEPGGVQPSPARPTPLLPHFLSHRCQPLTPDAPPRLPASATPRVSQPGVQPVACGSPDGSESPHPQNGGGIQAFRSCEERGVLPPAEESELPHVNHHRGGACLPSPGLGPWKGPRDPTPSRCPELPSPLSPHLLGTPESPCAAKPVPPGQAPVPLWASPSPSVKWAGAKQLPLDKGWEKAPAHREGPECPSRAELPRTKDAKCYPSTPEGLEALSGPLNNLKS